VSYPGSKGQAGTWQRIIGQMPAHSLYVEAFAGSAQVFWRKRPAAVNVLIDADAGVVADLRSRSHSAGFNAPGREAVTVLNADAIHWLRNADLPADAVVYCDPPYLLETRRSRRYYHHELTNEDHSALLAALVDLKCRVLLSGYPSPLYGDTLQNWRCCSYKARTRGSTVTECLWMNFPEPTALHDWRYAGKSYRERLALNRLAARWAARLDRMPARKRGFVLDGIRQRYF
jgi:DNA adenine methylase